jgi:hypothetical protein
MPLAELTRKNWHPAHGRVPKTLTLLRQILPCYRGKPCLAGALADAAAAEQVDDRQQDDGAEQ